MSCNGKLINSYTPNTNPKSPIEGFEIVTCRELPDYNGGTILEEVRTAEEFLNADEEALDHPFYRVFAVYRKETNRSKKAIADFYDVRHAMFFIQDLTGIETHIYSF
ncbi:MAG: hypothetical protein VKK05_01105 [Synechococcus sp.]|nr:hypothetical protein [Synechococcus sp.]